MATYTVLKKEKRGEDGTTVLHDVLLDGIMIVHDAETAVTQRLIDLRISDKDIYLYYDYHGDLEFASSGEKFREEMEKTRRFDAGVR